MKRVMNKKGNILLENVIFIILNLAFLSILILFLFRQGGGAIILEQSYSKNIALLIDSAKPGTEMNLNMKDAFDLAEKNGVKREEIVKVAGNYVSVRLTSDGGYQYYFFSDVNATASPAENSKDKYYTIKINHYN